MFDTSEGNFQDFAGSRVKKRNDFNIGIQYFFL
jgi:hypothetical protein